MFGVERLKEFVAEVSSETSLKIVEHIKRNLLAFSKTTSQADDIALITLKIC
jgi:serine phosphatase RsbU (regulator of sigma subunit)